MNFSELPSLVRMCIRLIQRWLRGRPDLWGITIEQGGEVVAWRRGTPEQP